MRCLWYQCRLLCGSHNDVHVDASRGPVDRLIPHGIPSSDWLICLWNDSCPVFRLTCEKYNCVNSPCISSACMFWHTQPLATAPFVGHYIPFQQQRLHTWCKYNAWEKLYTSLKQKDVNGKPCVKGMISYCPIAISMNNAYILDVYKISLKWYLYFSVSGPRLNIKTVFPRYGDSHVKDKTVARPSYLSHGDPYIGKTISLYWDGPQVSARMANKTWINNYIT